MAVLQPVWEAELQALPLSVAEWVRLRPADCVPVAHRQTVGVEERLGALALALALPQRKMLGVALLQEAPLPVSNTLSVVEGVAEVAWEAVAQELALPQALLQALPVRVPVKLAVAQEEGEAVAVAHMLAEAVKGPLRVAVKQPLEVTVRQPLGVAVLQPLAVAHVLAVGEKREDEEVACAADSGRESSRSPGTRY